MTRDPDLDALAEAIAEAQARNARWTLGDRLLGKVVLKAGPFAVAAVIVTVLLARAGADLGRLLMAMFYGSPFIAATVVSFVVVAWRQNTGLTYTPPVDQTDLASEPGQARPDHVRPEVAAGHLARPTQPTTVTVTVLPTPVAELPHAVGQGNPIHYPAPITEEEETP